MWWLRRYLQRWDLGLSIFFILLTILLFFYCNRIESYQIEKKELLIGSWWCHIDTPNGHIDQERERRASGPKLANDLKNNPSKPPRSK